jgi:ABC-type branched-subunit amino acid transport system ATPase component
LAPPPRCAPRAPTGGATSRELSSTDVELGFFEIMHRLVLLPTIQRLLVAFAVIGVLLVPFQTFLFFFLEERWGLGPGQRGVFFAFAAAVAIGGLALFGKRGEAAFRHDPARMLDYSAYLLIAGVLLIAAGALSPLFWLMIVCLTGGLACIVALNPAVYSCLLSVVPPRMRPHAGAITGVFLAGVGGLLGAIFLTGIEDRYGIVGAMLSLVVPGVAGALVLRSARRFVVPDLDRLIDEVIEDEQITKVKASGGRLPMLACRGVDFSYGQLQVLFDVDFTCDEGEMVALLGTNGAGKSTLLKVISGIGLPSNGTVRYRGQEITYLDAERRLQLGITQVPGGRAVFGPMSVVENLRLFGYSLGRDRRKVNDAIERSLEAFPSLADRRHQAASSLSGGEQQMLGLSKALMLRPKLLLIDELSLGLAPVIVGELLDMVRQINNDGTAVVLVEQSLNIALALVDHAYFMEKGEIRFDGRADELLNRDDLLRAVFLEGTPSNMPG